MGGLSFAGCAKRRIAAKYAKPAGRGPGRVVNRRKRVAGNIWRVFGAGCILDTVAHDEDFEKCAIIGQDIHYSMEWEKEERSHANG